MSYIIKVEKFNRVFRVYYKRHETGRIRKKIYTAVNISAPVLDFIESGQVLKRRIEGVEIYERYENWNHD